jgi:formylglycine-generating enzyme required for sulfatase activity
MHGGPARSWRRTFCAFGALAALFVCEPACSPGAPARPQLVVVVDTDAHLVGELASRPEVSEDAAIDTVRIDVLDGSNHEYDTTTIAAPELGRWPISFGVAPSSSGTSAEVHLRIRAFRANFARAGRVNGAATLDPPPEIAIDRLATIPLPTAGVTHVRVLLREDCMGTAPSFAAPVTTCIDTTHLAADPHGGVDVLSGAPPPTLARTWPTAVEQPCTVQPAQDQVCIPGGFSILGDYTAVGIDEGISKLNVDPVPLRPVVLRPFLLDKTEFTVGRFRDLVRSGRIPSGMIPRGANPGVDSYCTWLSTDDGSHDNLPINCLSVGAAIYACSLRGGALPTEAQWEHAARGRGQQRRFPWGDSDPLCCAVSASRSDGTAMGNASAACRGYGTEAVGSHAPSPTCRGLGDESRDGALDLAGSVAEALSTPLVAYRDACWGKGIVHDPACGWTDSTPRAQRGASWGTGLPDAWLVLRHEADEAGTANDGFRCAYPGTRS